MAGKIIYILCLNTVLGNVDISKQLNPRLMTFMTDLEHKAAAIPKTNDKETHSYMIQKEKEKLSMIPMIPIGKKQGDGNEIDLDNLLV